VNLNSKQIVAAISAVVLLFILVYPTFATGTVAVQVHSSTIEKAEHIYVTIRELSVHHSAKPTSEGWELVSNQSQTIDLISLENSSVLLGRGQIALGDYDTIRMEITNVTWVFNGTTTKLELESSRVQSNIDFTVQAGRESLITLVLSGGQENLGGTKFFVATLKAAKG
jgi:hypothetical protein